VFWIERQGDASTGHYNGARAFFWLFPILCIAYVRFCACLYRFRLLRVGKNTRSSPDAVLLAAFILNAHVASPTFSLPRIHRRCFPLPPGSCCNDP